jgi:hypothetical protein
MLGRPCSFDLATGRPVFGYLRFNFAYIDISWTHDYDFQMLVLETIKSLFHIIVFTPGTFYNFPDASFNDSNRFYTLNLTDLNTLTYNYYKDVNIFPFLNNQGTIREQTYYYAKRYFPTKIMVPSLGYYTKITNQTLNLLSLSGWYNVNYSMAETTFMAKGGARGFFLSCFFQGARTNKQWWCASPGSTG